MSECIVCRVYLHEPAGEPIEPVSYPNFAGPSTSAAALLQVADNNLAREADNNVAQEEDNNVAPEAEDNVAPEAEDNVAQEADNNVAREEVCENRLDLRATPCGHVFHRICIEYCEKKQEIFRCPSCFTILNPETITRVFMPEFVDETEFRQPSLPPSTCMNKWCLKIRWNHDSFVPDLERLKEAYGILEDEKIVVTAQKASLQDLIDKVKLETEKLEVDESD